MKFNEVVYFFSFSFFSSLSSSFLLYRFGTVNKLSSTSPTHIPLSENQRHKDVCFVNCKRYIKNFDKNK